MKTSIVLVEGAKQIMFTAENETEKLALSMFSVNDEISLVQTGRFHGNLNGSMLCRHNVSSCQGGWLRLFEENDSVMILLTPKSTETKNEIEELLQITGCKTIPEVVEYVKGINKNA